jgi:hypothetical protein
MSDIKHVGRVKATNKKVLVAYRTLPGESDQCLVIPTENLPDSYHDSLIQLVESSSAQDSFEFADVLARGKFQDGSTMLAALHTQGRLVKISTSAVEMTPNFQAKIGLDDLNEMIAKQRNCSIDDLAMKDPRAVDPNVEIQEVATVKDMMRDQPGLKTTSESINTDEQPVVENLTPEAQAKRFRSEADRLAKQAAELRRQAEALVPTKKAK